MLIIFSVTLGEAFSQCLLFNESKLCNSSYNNAIEYNGYYYIVGGGIDNPNEADYCNYFNAMIVKSDACGKIIWRKFIGQIGFYDNSVSQILCYDGYLYLLGLTSENSLQSTSFMAKLDMDGNLIWYQTYRTNNNDITCYRMMIHNNTLLVYGYHEVYENKPYTYNFYIMEIDTSGYLFKEHEYNMNNGRTYFGKIFKTTNGFLAFGGVNNGFKYGKDSFIYENGMVICKLNEALDIIKIDTIGSQIISSPQTIDYNPIIKKYMMHLSRWINNDSTYRQIAFLDSTGKLEKIIDDPFKYNVLPINLVAFKDGWIANYDYLVCYDGDFKEKKRIQVTRIDTGYIKATSTTIVKNGNAILITGNCNACNPYDDNSNSRYDRPTAIIVDSNFRDYGKAQAPPIIYDAIKAFPNPALESIILQITETEAVYSIYNSMGMFVSLGSMASSVDISLLNMASGMYIIQLKSPQGNHIGSVKFVKK